VLVLLPTTSDLITETLVRSRRANLLPIGDPAIDSLVPSVWLSRMRTDVAALRPGQRLLVDATALHIVAALRHRPTDVLRSPIEGGSPELEWILQAITRRFTLVPVHRGADGLIVARLALR
jgi:hypothetical protein